MTRKEAIKEMIRAYDVLDFNCHMDNRRKEAFNMAKVALEQEPSSDLISKQSVLNACEQSINILEAVDRIMDLPSVTQEPKTGHWIKSRDCYGNHHFTCSECGNDITTQYADNWEDKYCSQCGCRMFEPQERSEE